MTTPAEREQRERVDLAMNMLNGDKITKQIKERVHKLTGLPPSELMDFSSERRKDIAEKLIGRSVWVTPRTKIGREKGWSKSAHFEKAVLYHELTESGQDVYTARSIVLEELGGIPRSFINDASPEEDYDTYDTAVETIKRPIRKGNAAHPPLTTGEIQEISENMRKQYLKHKKN
ncbi:MAG: hypothetical protein JJE30_08875 [Desulfuromonadales bacterium]|nr:hypothetical protein [Desulfuromonadales bacterium]